MVSFCCLSGDCTVNNECLVIGSSSSSSSSKYSTEQMMLKSSLSRSFRFCLKSRHHHHHHFVSSNQRFFFASFTTNSTAPRRRRRKLHSYNLLLLLCSHFSVSEGLDPTTPISVNIIRSMSSSETSSSVVENVVIGDGGVHQAELLGSFEDDHGGVIVEIKKPMDPEIFLSSLKASMSHWKQQGKKGVWIKLPIELVNLVEAAVNEGFWYHHAEPKYLMLVYWIPETINTLPANATHRVGIGAFVINDKREILVVQENSGVFRGTGVWKFPTGVVNEGEDISIGAVREVKEETGIDTEFVEVLAFMQSHKSFFDKSDLFFVCMLRPLSLDIQKQELEIEAAQWMPIEEFAAQPLAQKQGLLKNMIDIGLAKLDNAYTGFSPVPTALSFSNHQSSLYLNTRDLNLKP